MSAAAKAAKDPAREVDGEAALIIGPQWIMDRTWAAKLVSRATRWLVLQQVEYLFHRDRGAQGLIIDAGHGGRDRLRVCQLGEDEDLPSTRLARWARYDLPSSFMTMAPSTTRSRNAIASGGSPK